jgi:uncharacterized protein (TIGR03435 family)
MIGMRQMIRVGAFAAWMVLGISAWTAAAQDAGQQPTKSQMMPKGADPDWEVVTVKPRDPYTKSDYIDAHGRHVAFQNETAENLLLFGYNVQKNQIANAPDWVKMERCDVDGLADVDGEPNVAQLQALARKALAERFGLQLHREQREMPVFALRADKGGPKLATNTSDPNGQRNEHRSAAGVGWHTYAYTNTSMPVFVLDILSYVDRPVVDQTGLKRRYDFQLKWLTDDNHATDPDAPPGLFTAIQEQLGLKLEPTKASTDVLVIDSIQRPGAN